MAETPRQRMVRGYAYSIVIDGVRTFETVPATYHEEVKQYIADNFTLEQIDAAYGRGSLTETEYRDIVARKAPAA